MRNKTLCIFSVLVSLGLFSSINAVMPVSAANDTSYSLGWQPSNSSISYNATNGLPKNSGGGISTPCKDGLPGLANGKCGDENLDFGSLSNTMADCTLAPSVSCIASLEIFQGQAWARTAYLGPVSDTPVRSQRPLPRWDAFPDLDIGPSNHSAVYSMESSIPELRLWVVTVDYRFSSSDIASPDQRSYRVNVAPVARRTPISACSGTRSIFINEVECYQVLDIPKGFRARLTLDLRHKPSGWINTYLQSAAAQSQPDKSQTGRYVLSIEGTTTLIPSASLSVPYSNVERRERLCATWPQRSGFCGPENTMSWGVTYNTLGGQGIPRKFLFDNFTKYVGIFPELDTATAENQFWVFSFSTSDAPQTESCAKQDGIYGLAGGNSMVISDEIPLWNAATTALEFTVASPHYRPNGDTAQGFYEMQLNQKVANCLWGTKITPTNVTLSILDAQGEAKVATSQVSVKDGVVIFRATGFTYSTTKLRATLKGAAKVKSSQLVCSRNGITKVQPRNVKKCPNGWKKG
jgi:hypothetical protein